MNIMKKWEARLLVSFQMAICLAMNVKRLVRRAMEAGVIFWGQIKRVDVVGDNFRFGNGIDFCLLEGVMK